MKNLLYSLCILFFTIVVFNSCEKPTPKPELMYNAINITTPAYVSFVNPFNTFTIEPDNNGEFYNNEYEISIMTIGSIHLYDVSVHFEIETITDTEDTINAIEGVHYELSADSFIIPANSNEGSINITLLYETLPFEQYVLLKMNLLSGNFDTIPILSSSEFTLYNPYQVHFDVSQFLGEFICDEPDYGLYGVSFTLDPIVENRIHNENFWDWAASGSTIYYDFSGDSTQTIIIPTQSFTFGDGVVGMVDGSGTYDADSETLTCDYNIWHEGTNYPTHHYFYRPYKKSATKISKTKAELMQDRIK
ncbi:MAG: hypothetical protein HN704_18200 [Bacteroidetes bacterium]|jgi:hypothetical protein|nr:hypothetical protein [Bacteroidota bacterium]MBT6685086.1 hypothetical protein [Bacteroidota bacterium]MBT7142610.1 hypothetical protein [Bacteroidota bacterium]MBT7493535.1 hypothetical protein [Bacteroidota bacterium]